MLDKKHELIVLFLEDSDEDYTLIVRALEKGHFKIIPNRVDSFEKFKEQVTFNPPDIIISDYSLQGFTGIDALNFIKENNFDAPFVVVSGYIGEEKAVEFLKLGAKDYISKESLEKLPIALERVMHEVRLSSEKKLTQRKLEAEIERNKKLVTAMSEGLVLLDDRNQIIFTNRAFQKMIGYSEGELNKIRWVQLLKNPPEFVPLISRTEGRREVELLNKFGDSVWVEISLSEIYDGDSRQIIKVISDKTAERESEERLKELNSEMEQLIYRASHDLRGPISSMEGLLENLKLTGIDNEIAEAFEEMIDDAYQILDSLALVTKYQHNPLNVETIFIKSMLVIMCEEYFSDLSNKIKFDLEIMDLYTDKGAFETILRNLMDNILNHAYTEGKKLEVKFSSKRIKDYILFCVEDNGPGILPQHQEKIFNMFYRANPAIHSTGLGLYLSKKIAKRLGGDLSLEYSGDRGTRFCLAIPDLTTEKKS
ncbi:hybrid sensor histidine kinase/response regulator [Luteibaculum oceani]|uniref:histidine kinase n=1 Tax=Luteibaculum oceani TaxID=1294296 RepID=A0A5C6VLJ9_9FLAO|nr:ATP-binding protein [Luteibaculum oceani]TXC85316.1 response regulator [Luteibaculum oceani]